MSTETKVKLAGVMIFLSIVITVTVIVVGGHRIGLITYIK
jgi:hypothetical protein